MDFDFLQVTLYLAYAMLIWNCIAVGQNDAANIVNAVFGSRVLERRAAVILAGTAVVLGATFSSGVIETARKGIFSPTFLESIADSPTDALIMAVTIYISVYIVNTVLLNTYSAFGMPVSTTATLIFSLLGASFAVAGQGIVQWGMAGQVLAGIVISIIASGIASFMIQRAFRAAVRNKAEDPAVVYLHGPWIASAMVTMLFWFMLMKGLKGISLVKTLKSSTLDEYGEITVLFILWVIFTALIKLVLYLFRKRGAIYLFRVTAVLGMLCMAFAFGQNDLANCASPGLSIHNLYKEQSVNIGNKVPIAHWQLFICGVLIMMGMFTKKAQRVTRAEVNTGSQFDTVALWAPKWCQAVARFLLRFRVRRKEAVLAPPPSTTDTGKKVHYDTLRASVIMSVSASVIAFASSLTLPVSTTYVAFAAVVATGMADRIFVRGDSVLKVGRTIWVVSSWFISAILAMFASGFIALMVLKLGILGLVLGLGINYLVCYYGGRRAEKQEEEIRQQARERQQSSHSSGTPLLDELDKGETGKGSVSVANDE
jgi:phosphate/sulfate permease